MGRFEELNQQLAEEQLLLADYEKALTLTDEPRQMRKNRQEIKRQQEAIAGLLEKLARFKDGDEAEVATRRYHNNPYTLDDTFQGRREELKTLNDWLRNNDARPIFTLVALGGTGKSALAWRWLSQLEQQPGSPVTDIIWWDFYQTGSSAADFLSDALTFLEDVPPANDNLRLQTNRLLEALRERRVLLVMDGAERLLRAYSSLNAPYQGDEAGGDGSGQQDFKRDCVDPVMAAFLRGLVQLRGGKTLITSRLMPRELENREGRTLPGVQRIDLTGLDPDDAVDLFHEMKVTATRAEIIAAGEPLGYHPLSLRLLAGYAANDPALPNDLRAAANYNPNDNLVAKRTHILKRAYDSLPKSAQTTLSKLAVFRSSVPWPVIEAVFVDENEAPPGEKKSWFSRLFQTQKEPDILGNSQTVKDNLTLLEKRGLLQRTTQPATNQQPPTTYYDLHPIVRRYAYDRLAKPAATHDQLAGYFEAVPPPTQVETLADLEQSIELYYHLAQARYFDDAFAIFRDRLAEPLYYHLGAYQTRIELLSVLFPDGEDRLPRLKEKGEQASTLNALAVSYSLAGRPHLAIPLFEQGAKILEKLRDLEGLPIMVANLAILQVQIGDLEAAEDNLRDSADLSRAISMRTDEATWHLELGRLLAYCGRWEEITAEFRFAQAVFSGKDNVQGQGITGAYRALAALLQNDNETAVQFASEALRFAEKKAQIDEPVERDFVRAYWMLGWAELANGDLTAANEHLDEALRRCRAINSVEAEPAIMLALARLARAKDILYQAAEIVEEALLIAERSGYVLDLADIHNFLAQLALDTGDQDAARDHATQARDYAFCDGPPHTYKVALEEAERLIGLIG